MKQGSTDDPFAEEPRNEGADEDRDAETPRDGAEEPRDDDAGDEPATADADSTDSASQASAPTAGSIDRSSSSVTGGSAPADRDRTGSDASTDPEPSGGEAAQRQTLPYIHARDGVKDGRTQRPVFLRDHVEAGIDDLVAEMEAELGADVYKTDVTEAAMAVAQENPELVLAKLEEWGYGWT
ncbi:hypothetical protein [Halosimplex amylolyticum]|uniref:hypothetical protein n=1 Tax=Halosimplex amylolyticum TaxID=3396616 RepID=UPI003F55C7BE